MSRKDREVRRRVAVDRLEEVLCHAVFAGHILKAEQPAAHQVDVLVAVFKTDDRKTAVAGDEGRDTLPQERLEEGERIFADRKPVVVRVPIDKARGEGQTAEVDLFIRCGYFCAGCIRNDRDNFFVFNQYAAGKRIAAGAVVDAGVLDQCFHPFPPSQETR